MDDVACLQDLADLPTPALVVAEEILQRNIAAMARFATATKCSLRPHAKTHKCVEIAKLQIAAGAVGISCATISELEAMAEAGLPGLLLTAPFGSREAAERLAALSRRHAFSLVCDHPEQVAVLAACLGPGSRPLPVLIDVDVGQKRTGVTSPQQAMQVARAIAAAPNLHFAGLQGFAGQAQHVVGAGQRQQAAADAAAQLSDVMAGLREAGFACPLVTGSGTGTAVIDAVVGPYTELQVGSYVFMDADYARLEPVGASEFETSLFVLASVVSCNRPGQVTIDAGTKAFAFNGPAPHVIVNAPAGTQYSFAGDEHGVLQIPAGSAAPKLGSKLLLSATHCDPTVNLYGALNVWAAGQALRQWRIVGRHGA